MAAKDTTIQEEILDEFQKEELELVRKSNVDLSKYDWQQMREIRKGLRDNINLISYVEKGYSTDILRQVRKARNSGVEIEQYVKDGYDEFQIKEIRTGLEEKIDVSDYASVIWGPQDMHDMRIRGEKIEYPENDFLFRNLDNVLDENIDEVTSAKIQVNISEDAMTATMFIPRPIADESYSKEDLLIKLKECGVTEGINQKAIENLSLGKCYDIETVVALGKEKEDGKDGFFTYFFKTELPKVPKIKTDGSVDYQNIDFFEIVKEGQKLAEYTPSTTGYYGYTVTGKMTAPKRGKNLPQLVGKNPYFLKHIEKMDKRLAVLTEEIDVYRRRLIQYSKSIDKKKLEKTTLFQNIEFELLKRVQELDDINKQKQGYSSGLIEIKSRKYQKSFLKLIHTKLRRYHYEQHSRKINRYGL